MTMFPWDFEDDTQEWGEEPAMHLTDNEAAIKLAERDNLVGELVEALENLLGWVPGRAVWLGNDDYIKAVKRARTVIAKAREGAES